MRKLLNFGSLNIDYTYSVNKFVSSGQTIKAYSMNRNIGGKGLNQSVAFAKAGGCVYHAGKIGNDGLFLKEYLQKNNVNTDFIDIGASPSGHAIIQVDESGKNCIIVYGGANNEITNQYVDEVLTHFGKDDVLLLQNEINNNGYIVKRAHEKGMYVVLNPSPAEGLNLPTELVDCFILNEYEAKILFSAESVDEAIKNMTLQYPKACFVLTLGSDGSMYIDAERKLKADALKVNAVDTTAAGDTYTGYFLNSAINGNSPESSLEIASRAAAVTVSRHGAAESIPHYYEL